MGSTRTRGSQRGQRDVGGHGVKHGEGGDGTGGEESGVTGTGTGGATGPLTELQALARSTLERLRTSVLKTFIFSTRQVRAVSVASPTFS